MGWGRMLLLGNWGQQMDIEDQRKELEALRHQLAGQRHSTDTGGLIALERENAELRLYVAAIVRYLVAKGSIDPSEFGSRIVFWGGGCDTQHVLGKSSPEEIRQHVRERLKVFAPGGGYVFTQVHNVQPDIPSENVIAMFDAAREFGTYRT